MNDLPAEAATSEDGARLESECPAPLDPPMVPFAVGGMTAWALAGLVVLAMHTRLSAAGHSSWLWICLAGFLFGIPGLITMVRHDARRAARNEAPGAAQQDAPRESAEGGHGNEG